MSDLYQHLTETFIFEDLYRIHWARLGDKTNPAVVFVHGTPFSSLEWLPAARALQKRYCVYLWDLPGFGASQEPLDSHTQDFDVGLAAHGRAFAALCEHWGFSTTNPPHVIAHDIGGAAVLRAHLVHQVKYASLCLLDIVAISPWGTPFLRAIQSNPEAFEAIPPAMFKGMLREYVQSASYKPLSQAKMDGFVRPRTDSGEEGRKRFIRQIRWLSQDHTQEFENDLSKVVESNDDGPKKLKILWGEEDTWLPIQQKGDKLAELTGAPEYVKVPDAGHLLQVDQPEIFMYEIVSWLTKVAR